MAKIHKNLRKKKIVKQISKGDNHSHLKRSALFILVALFSFTASYLFFNHTTTQACANSKSCTSDLSLHVDNNTPGFFAGQKVYPPQINMTEENNQPVLGDATASGEKHIYVDLSTQTLFAYQGTSLILQTFVSTGKWNPTPVGNFHVWEKLRSTRMAGGEGADAYDLPNVPYVMYFYQDFGLHGAYWHDNFGHMMSHGCVNLRQVDAKTLYDWADGPSGNTPGTAVSICNMITQDKQCIQNNPIQ